MPNSSPQTKDGSNIDLLTKLQTQNASFSQIAEYKGRLVLTKDLSLQISQAKMTDQRTFTCMLVTSMDILEFPVDVSIESEWILK